MITSQQFDIGEQPGNGSYRCCKCGNYLARLLSPDEQLPPCGNCGSAADVHYQAEDNEATESHGP